MDQNNQIVKTYTYFHNLHRKMSLWENFSYFFKMWLCRLTKMIDGYEIWNHFIHFLFVVLIISWLYNLILLLWWLCHLFGIKMTLWRLWCAFGICFEIGCLQRIIFFIVELLVTIPECALEGAVMWKLLLIYSYIVIILGPFGTLFIIGWALPRLSLFM